VWSPLAEKIVVGYCKNKSWVRARIWESLSGGCKSEGGVGEEGEVVGGGELDGATCRQ
jgi:hypothetical protein